jgi:hypothetical protein
MRVNTLADHYRCNEAYGTFRLSRPLTPDEGYFKLDDAVCFGRTATGFVGTSVDSDLYDATEDVTIDRWGVTLPFDPGEVIENLRYERYVNNGEHRGLLADAVRKAYYTFRPLMGVNFRKHLQRIYLNRRREISFPRWPVDRTVEAIYEQLIKLSLRSRGVREMPFVWFWPSGYSGCLILTHDIETKQGRDFSLKLADIDAAFGMKSSFQIVPEDRYEVSPAFLDSLRERKCEINLHGLNHDGSLFEDRATFLRQAEQINVYARKFGASGFRSPVLYRNLDWYADLDFSYDMSVPNCAHLDAQRGGCCTVLPYFVGDMLELPLTMTQDYSLFNILRQSSIELWKQQIDLVLEKHGLISFNVHPDYLLSDTARKLYEELLSYLREVCAQRHVWVAAPGEVDQWWRQRHEMQLSGSGAHPQISGGGSERARLAYARVDGGNVVYSISGDRLPAGAPIRDRALTAQEA